MKITEILNLYNPSNLTGYGQSQLPTGFTLVPDMIVIPVCGGKLRLQTGNNDDNNREISKLAIALHRDPRTKYVDNVYKGNPENFNIKKSMELKRLMNFTDLHCVMGILLMVIVGCL
jgi:hypothetical protein